MGESRCHRAHRHFRVAILIFINSNVVLGACNIVSILTSIVHQGVLLVEQLTVRLILVVNKLRQAELGRLLLDLCVLNLLVGLAVAQTAPIAKLDATAADVNSRRALLLSIRLWFSRIFLILGLRELVVVLFLELAEDGDELEVDLVCRALRDVERQREHVEGVPVDRLVVLGHVEEESEFVR